MERRKPYWDKLEALVTACARRGVAALDRDELRELALLYRQTAADLATVREHQDAAHLSVYLNRLLGSAHNLVYAAPRARAGTFAAFIIRTIPATFRHGKVFGAAVGEPRFAYYAEFEFPDKDTFRQVAGSPEFAAAGQDAAGMGIPFTVHFAEVAELD